MGKEYDKFGFYVGEEHNDNQKKDGLRKISVNRLSKNLRKVNVKKLENKVIEKKKDEFNKKGDKNHNKFNSNKYNKSSGQVQLIKMVLRKPNELRLNPHILSLIVLDKNNIVFMDSLRMYIDEKGYYQKISSFELKQLIYKAVPHTSLIYTKSYEIEDAARLLKINPYIQVDLSCEQKKHHKHINCLNGLLHLNKAKLEEHSKEKYFVNCVNCNYIKNYDIRKTNFSLFINTVTCGDSEMIKMIRQIMGYCFSNFNNAKKAFLLFGESNTGKSVFLELLSEMCGQENVSNIPLQSLGDEKYTAELVDKRLNVCNELPDTKLRDTAVFKSLVSESDKVIARPLYSQPFSFYNKAKLIFATNNLPKIATSGSRDNSAFFNRIIIVPFVNPVPEDKQDKNLIKKLIKEKDVIFSWAVDGLREYIENDYNFHICKKTNLIMNNYRKSQDIIVSFVEDCCILYKDAYVHKYKLDEAYLIFCEDNGFDIPDSNSFKELKNIILNKYGCIYTRINKGGENKYGFKGISLKKKF